MNSGSDWLTDPKEILRNFKDKGHHEPFCLREISKAATREDGPFRE